MSAADLAAKLDAAAELIRQVQDGYRAELGWHNGRVQLDVVQRELTWHRVELAREQQRAPVVLADPPT